MYGYVSALVAITYEVISFSKTDFTNTPLPTNFGKTGYVFFNGEGPGFVQISVCTGKDSKAALHWQLECGTSPSLGDSKRFRGWGSVLAGRRGNSFSSWPFVRDWFGLFGSNLWGAEPWNCGTWVCHGVWTQFWTTVGRRDEFKSARTPEDRGDGEHTLARRDWQNLACVGWPRWEHGCCSKDILGGWTGRCRKEELFKPKRRVGTPTNGYEQAMNKLRLEISRRLKLMAKKSLPVLCI